MLTIKQKIYFFAFVISPVLYFGEANALEGASTQMFDPAIGPAAIEPQINRMPAKKPEAAVITPAPATPETVAIATTTLASSNAPATTIEGTQAATGAFLRNGMESNTEDDIDDVVGDGDGGGEGIVTTMLPENLQQITKMDDAMFTTLATAMLLDGDNVETTASKIGNGVKAGVKNSNDEQQQQHVPLRGEVQIPVTENPLDAHKRIDMQDGGRKLEMPQAPKAAVTTRATIHATPTPTVDADADTPRSKLKFVGNLKNGLYRIKLAETANREHVGGQPKRTNAPAKTAEKENAEKEKQNPDNKQFVAADAAVTAAAAATSAAGKVNIADLYPMKKEDFDPLIRDSNTKSEDESTVFKKPDDEAEYRQNLLPNEVEFQQQQNKAQRGTPASTARPQLPQQTTTPMANDSGTISEFTGKLLADEDSIITEIEQKFRLDEFGVTESNKSTNASKVFVSTAAEEIDNMTTMPTTISSTSSTKTTTTTTTPKPTTTAPATTTTMTNAPATAPATDSPSNREVFKAIGEPTAHHFIDRRVKKSFIFPMHRAASDVMSEPYVDFANTKFTGGSSALIAKTFTPDSPTNGGGNAAPPSVAALTGAVHPEFSTTKFYNSKELYNEMIMHNRLKQLQNKSGTSTTAVEAKPTEQPLGNGLTAAKTATTTTTTTTITSTERTTAMSGEVSRFASLRNIKSNLAVSKDPLSSKASSLDKLAKLIATANNTSGLGSTAVSSTTTTESSEPSAGIPLEISSVDISKSKKFQKELKRAKLMLKVVLPSTAKTPSLTRTNRTENVPRPATVTTSTLSSLVSQSMKFSAVSTSSPPMTSNDGNRDAYSPITVTTIASTTSQTMDAVTNPTTFVSKPIARPRTLTSLQEKINLLECEIQNVPQESHLWRGNETHELLLPIITPAQCAHSGQQANINENRHECSSTAPAFVSWEGESEIQSGDILIVEINDASLLKDNHSTYSAHFTQVYQVTRSGHEHCDVTEGILLDITPLVVDGRKLVTLYDKDLTEGVNLLIVVSELWGSQCVRLKVTAKTDNCGENADCSGKGVCYSNSAMEEYECQCCSGFAGPHCEEIDACTPSPCTNNGICVDLSQGHDGNSYQCLCPYGYTGKNCQYEAEPCNPAECLNGGSCVGNSTHFRCDCTAGFAGPLCQHSLNECESSPCVHGICVDQEDGFRCFCQPGFAGELCNFEYNECESNPCQNGAECIDHIGSFECRCTKGYSGIRCQTKVDFCASKPCPEGHHCIDHGNDFSCECPGGRNGPECNQMARTQCNVNPCTHGGTCWSSGDSFYCACRPGYTGTMCEDEFVVETVVSSSEFIVDDVNAQNFNEKPFGSSVVLKSPVELHNAYFAAGVLAAAFFIVAVVVTICHCKVNQTYRKFSTRTTSFIPIIGFGRRSKPLSKLNKHWLSGKGLGSGNSSRSASATASASNGQLISNGSGGSTALHHSQQQHNNIGQLHERPFQKHLAMNLENDMYYTVDFSENSQHSPLIQ